MKLALVAVAITVLSIAMSVVGFFAGPEEEAELRAFGVGVITLILACIAAFAAAFIATRRNRLQAMLFIGVVLVVAGSAAVIAYFAGSEIEAVPRACAIGLLTLLIGGGVSYLAYYAWGMKNLDISPEELKDDEILWAKTAQSMVHYKSGNPLKFWEAVGGRLFLTNQVLEFRTFPGELYEYEVMIPLREIRRAKPCTILGFIKGALRVERYDGTFELFTFGAAFDVSREWADAIMDFRDDLDDAKSA